MKKLVAAVMAIAVFAGMAMANDYDVVILNGRVWRMIMTWSF